jgi:hypothetical protein
MSYYAKFITLYLHGEERSLRVFRIFLKECRDKIKVANGELIIIKFP